MRGRGALLGLFAVLALLLRTPESAAQPFDPARPLGLRPPLGASIRPANAVPPPSRKRLSEVAKFRAAHPHFKPERRDLTQIAEDAGVWDSIDDQTDGLETMVNLDSSDAVLERPNVAESRRRRRRQLVPRLACVPNLAFKNKTLCDTIYAGASYADMGSANGRHAFIVSDGKPRIILAGRIAPRWQLTMPTNLNGMSGCTTYATRMTALGDIILSCNNRQWANITVRNNGKYPRSMTIDNYGSVRFYSFNGALLLTITPGLQPSPIGALTLKTLAVTSSKTRTTSRTKTRTATRTTTRFTTSMTRSTSSSETSSMTADETSTSLTIPDPTSSTTETTSSETATRSSSTSATRTATRTRTTTTSATRTTTATTTQTSSTSRTKTTTYTVIQSLVPRYPVQKEVGSYFTSWGIYERGFFPKSILSMKNASQLTFLNYAFANIYPRNGGYECGVAGAGEDGDNWADFVRGFSATESVDGVADTWDQQLAGNWNQLRKLKQRLPNLRILISVGGWSWSTHFSAASKTDELRKQLVGSCVELFIRGNVPGTDGRGGEGAAWGVFDGIDIDWEYPTGGGEAPGAPEDTVNYNLLLEEFRRQLDYVAYGVKRPYLLTVAVGSSKWQVDKTQPAVYSQSLDFINVMTYDLQGSWSGVGPTDFHCAHYADPSSPFYTWGPDLNLNHSISYFMSKGVPAEKLVAGIAFYGYGWTGVNMTKNNGTYQPSTAWAPGTYQTGTDDWNAIKLKNGTLAIHPVTGGAYKFSNITKQWWTFDSPQSITNKASWAKGKGLRGLFSWALSGDTAEGELVGKMALVK